MFLVEINRCSVWCNACSLFPNKYPVCIEKVIALLEKYSPKILTVKFKLARNLLLFKQPSSVSMEVKECGDELKASSETSPVSLCLYISAESMFLQSNHEN